MKNSDAVMLIERKSNNLFIQVAFHLLVGDSTITAATLLFLFVSQRL